MYKDYSSEKASKYAEISLQGEGTLFLAFRDLKSLIHQYFHPFESLRAVDYGCGAGRSSRYLKSLGIPRVDAFDVSEDMIKQAQGLDPQGDYKTILSAAVPVSDATYDLAFMSFVTVAIDNKSEISRVFKEVYRILKQGGQVLSLALSETFWNPKRRWVTYKQDYPENYSRVSGQKSRLTISSINLELTDYYWKESDIIDCAKEAHFSLIEIHHSFGRTEDGIAWQDEYEFAPYTIFSFRK